MSINEKINEKKKKININIDLAVLLSRDKHPISLCNQNPPQQRQQE